MRGHGRCIFVDENMWLFMNLTPGELLENTFFIHVVHATHITVQY